MTSRFFLVHPASAERRLIERQRQLCHGVRDLPIFDAQSHLLVHRYRVRCPVCGAKLEALMVVS